MERGDVPSDTSPLYFCLEKFAEGTCIQKNPNKVWFSLHLIVPLALPKVLAFKKTQIKFGFLFI